VSRPLPLLLLVLGTASATAACSGADADADALASAAARLDPADPACRTDDARPATGAPAEGLWLYEDKRAQHRVAAIIGPADAKLGRTQVTRRVETLEAHAGADTIRFVSDSAAVRLQLVPPFARPAAAYAVGPLVLLAAYEPCNPGMREPLIRYLRQDTGGRVATDVLLRREGAP
jgi:hypothetical protein